METAPNLQAFEYSVEDARRLKREEDRAYHRAINQHSALRAAGREGSTSYGTALFENYAETVAVAIDGLLTKLIQDPSLAGKHYSAWGFLLHFCNRGPRSIALITLGVIIDNITRGLTRKVMAYRIGKALQAEFKAIRIHQAKGQTLLRQLKKELGRGVVKQSVMRQLQVGHDKWTVTECRELGLLLLELIASNTTLIQFEGQRVAPTECSQELIDLAPPRPLPVRSLPRLVRLQPWEGAMRGGKQLVTSRKVMDLSHITDESVQPVLQVINFVEGQALEYDPWMLQQQRAAWDADLPLFPVSREPSEPFERRETVIKRVRVEEVLRQGEEISGLPFWLEHDMCFRGRVYAGSRTGSHQGPDHQKALINFRAKEQVNGSAFDRMLEAAGTHYGLKTDWNSRRAWAANRRDLFRRIAANPLDQIDHWKHAADPWQFLQIVKAIADHLEDDRCASGVPIRYDQTCSGLGHIGALIRDRELCRATNMIGHRRSDIYTEVMQLVRNQLELDLHSFDFAASRNAEFWLQQELGRGLAKGPVMTSVYGSRYFGLVDQFTSWLQEKNPGVSVADWEKQYTRPAQYMARQFSAVVKRELEGCLKLEQWLKDVSKACTKKNKRVEFNSPSGFPVALGAEVDKKQKVTSDLYGQKAWSFAEEGHQPGTLSARATNRGITANVIHVIDASYCHLVLCRCAGVGAQALSNHDCFAVRPSDATFLHGALLQEMRALHMPEWLNVIREEVSQNAGVKLPKAPYKGNVCEAQIGENPYVFS
ncbi:DNA-directed RNA polymerase [uncultured phage_MedDCM-OCT-S38-C3]|uniref:DNA-directed RNA polymerase n=1 Tax=uncultured phage_MedDCM-OCT-S38-C3 TaxID=2740803 RepID=A0A6S4P8N1_9CAUD|nr:DNA-directed RNA polymerase [uncultured phage_MedDCM-OCT-S38-C3]BAQ94429.1 DNA-directed RNA polymerase [uncultured phage_MedDCM-OCT-S38-C3]